MEDIREIRKRIARPSIKKIGSFGGFGRKFPLPAEPKKPYSPYDPNSPYLPKGQYSVATNIVALDGSGDFEDIQSAINDLPSSGGVVYVKEGTYNITSTISIMKNNISLIGAGNSTKLYLITDNIPVIQVGDGSTSLEGISIENLQIDGNSNLEGANTGIYFYGNSSAKISLCTVSSCYIHHLGSLGIEIVYLDYSLFFSNLIENNSDASMYVLNSTYNLFSGNQFNFDFYLKSSSSYNSLISNIFASGSSAAIHISSSPSNIINNNQISDSDFGMEILSNYTVVSGNFVHDCTTLGIDVEGDYCIVSDNICINNGGKGITPGWANNNLIIGNLVYGHTTGISVNSYSSNNALISNFLSNNTTAIGDSGTNTIIKNNPGYNPVGVSSITLPSYPSAWAASTAYALGDFVEPTTHNGYKYECTTAGTSGTTEPTWPTTPGNTVTDGTAVWTCREFTFTYMAGSSSETVFIRNGTVSDISKSSTTLFIETGHSIDLEPNESLIVTYTDTPTMIKDIH